MFYYAVGAIASPLLASNLIESYGPPALFAMIAVGHVVLIGFGVARMRRRPTLEQRTPYTYTPRTTFSMGAVVWQASGIGAKGRDPLVMGRGMSYTAPNTFWELT